MMRYIYIWFTFFLNNNWIICLFSQTDWSPKRKVADQTDILKLFGWIPVGQVLEIHMKICVSD